MRRLFPSSRRSEDVSVTRTTTSMQSTDLGDPSRRPAVIRIVTSLIIVAVLAVFLAAVATNHLPGGNTTAAPFKGGSIVDGVAFEPDTLLPYRTTSTWGGMADQAIWAPLWYGDPQGAFHPGIVTAVPVFSEAGDRGISTDLKTWTFHLRKGLKWSDGSPLTAEDCAFSFKLYADPAYNAGQVFTTTDPNDPIDFESATATDDQTVVLKIKHPYAAMLTTLADGVATCLPKEVFSGMTAAEVATSRENFQPSVVSGPFTVKERVAKDHMTVVRNPYYYQGPAKPYLDQITFKVVNGVLNGIDLSLARLQTHAVDTYWTLDYTKLDNYRAIASYTTYLDRSPAGLEVLDFNLRDPLMSDLRVRQAFTMGFNIGDVLQLLNGAAQKTCDDSSGTFAHEPKLTCYRYDPLAAGQALDDAGWTDRSPSGCTLGQGDCYRAKGGKTLELVYATTTKQVRVQTAALIQRELKGIGMKIDVKAYSFEDYFCQDETCVLYGGHFQTAVLGTPGNYDPDDHSTFASDQAPVAGGANHNNYMHYSNPEVDAEERIQQSTANINARTDAFHIIHADILNDLPVMYLYSPRNIACARSDLHNYDPSAFETAETWNIWDWWLIPRHTS